MGDFAYHAASMMWNLRGNLIPNRSYEQYQTTVIFPEEDLTLKRKDK
jgi:hypothetical protein